MIETPPKTTEEELVEKGRTRRDKDGLHQRGRPGRPKVWYTFAKVNRRNYEITLGTTSYNEAKKNRQRKIEEFIAKHRLPELAKLPTEKAADAWTEEREGRVSASTVKIEKQRLKPVKDRLGKILLCDLTPDHLHAYQHARAKKVSARTVNLEMKAMRQLLKRAKLWSRFADDYKPLPENRRGPGRALTPEQEAKLFEQAQKSLFTSAAFYAGIVAANTTMRSCELKGLRLRDVNLIDRVVTIHRSKTDAGARLIPLNGAAVWAFTKLFERARKLGARDQEHFLFPAFRCKHTKEGKAAGSGYDPTRPMVCWRSGWRSLAKNAGLKGLRFHDLRHSAITKLAEAGVPDQTLMSIAGHVSRSMLEHYSHIRTQAKRAAVEAIDNFKPPVAESADNDSTASQNTESARVN
jgi:integrase